MIKNPARGTAHKASKYLVRLRFGVPTRSHSNRPRYRRTLANDATCRSASAQLTPILLEVVATPRGCKCAVHSLRDWREGDHIFELLRSAYYCVKAKLNG